MLDSRDDTSRKALLILSDGEEVQPTGITKDEVIACLNETRIPVFTAAMLDAPWLAEQQESAKILGSFARESAGGIHTAFGLEDVSLEDGAARIASAVGKGMVLTGDLSEYQPGNGQAYLQVTFKVDGKGKAIDGYMVSEHELGIKAKNEEVDQEEREETEADDESDAETESDTQTDPEVSPESDSQTESDLDDQSETEFVISEEDGRFPGIPVIIAAALTLGILIFVLIMRKNSKENKTYVMEAGMPDTGKEEAKEVEQTEDADTAEADSGQEEDAEVNSREEQSLSENEPENRKESLPSAVIYITKIGLSEEKTYELHIRGETTLGRENQKANYAFPEDSHMSGVHCSLICYDGKIILQDKGSRNGTWVNGIPVTQPYVLKSDDVLHIGKTDFRVYWQRRDADINNCIS